MEYLILSMVMRMRIGMEIFEVEVDILPRIWVLGKKFGVWIHVLSKSILVAQIVNVYGAFMRTVSNLI